MSSERGDSVKTKASPMAKCWGANRWLDTVMREDIIRDYRKGCAVWAATNATTSSHVRKGRVYLGGCEQSFLPQVKEIIVGGTHFVLQKRIKRQTTPVHGTPRMTTNVILWFLFVKFIYKSKSCRPIAMKVLFRKIHDSSNRRFVENLRTNNSQGLRWGCECNAVKRYSGLLIKWKAA